MAWSIRLTTPATSNITTHPCHGIKRRIKQSSEVKLSAVQIVTGLIERIKCNRRTLSHWQTSWLLAISRAGLCTTDNPTTHAQLRQSPGLCTTKTIPWAMHNKDNPLGHARLRQYRTTVNNKIIVLTKAEM